MGIYMTGPAIGGVISLALTHSVLLPVLSTWRNVFFLWAAVTGAAALTWFLLARPRPDTGPTGTDTPSASRTPARELLRLPAVSVVLLMSIGVFLFNHGLNNWLPELLRSSGLTIVEAGYWAAIPTVIGIAGSLLIPRLATPERRFTILFTLCVAAALASVLLQINADLPRLTGLLLQGIARSSMMTVLILTLVELPGIGQQRAGTASGLFFSAAEVGGVMGPLGLGILFDLTGGFTAGLYFLTATALLLAGATLYLKRAAQADPGNQLR
jgi:cyanate permease